MSERLTPERLALAREAVRIGIPIIQMQKELLDHIDAQQAEIEAHQFASERDRKLILEGAREFVRRCQPKGNPSLNTTVESVLAEMEAENASR